jgi:hypothetical protein
MVHLGPGRQQRSQRVGVVLDTQRQHVMLLRPVRPADLIDHIGGDGGPASVAAGQAARTAASTAPGAAVPGTHTRIDKARPAHMYSQPTCGVPYTRRRHTDGVSHRPGWPRTPPPTPG